MKRSALIGGAIWTALAAIAWLQRLDFGWIDLLFLFAPLVIVPLGLELSAASGDGLAAAAERTARAIQVPAALLATGSFFFARGILAASLAVGWAVFCVLLAIVGCSRFARGAYRRLDGACIAVAFLYPTVGSAWLIASRLGLTPLGFQEPIVLLTAVHFHYAGFAAPLLAGSTARALSSRQGKIAEHLLRIVVAAVLLGPALLAAGFVIGPLVKLAAALVLATSEIGLAFFFFPAIRGTGSRWSKLLLAIASGSVIFSMIFAALWAIGEYPLQPFVHLDSMARFHGTANAFGFTLCGLLGFIIANRRADSERSADP